MKHALAKIPADISENLLIQRTYKTRDTVSTIITRALPPCSNHPQPIMLAVKARRADVIKLLLDHKGEVVLPTLLMRNSDGSIPLHVAARKGFASIASALATYGPPESLHLENAVGDTPLEIAQACLLRSNISSIITVPEPRGIDPTEGVPLGRLQHPKEADVKESRTLLSTLGSETTNAFSSNPNLRGRLEEFITRSEEYLRSQPEGEKGPQSSDGSTYSDSGHPEKTWRAISKAIPTGRRRLIHLMDSQAAAAGTIGIKGQTPYDNGDRADHMTKTGEIAHLSSQSSWLSLSRFHFY